MRLSKNLKHALTLCLALALIVCSVTIMPASAGKTGGYVVDSDMLSTERLTLAEWKFNETGVSLKDGVLYFDEFYDVENPVLSRTAAYSSLEVKQALEVHYTLSIDEIKGDRQFGLGFGIRRLDRDIDEEGSVFLYAQATEKGVGFGLSTVKDGEVVQLKELTHYGAKVKNVNITVRVTGTGALTVSVGDSIFYAGQPGEVTADGFLGFSSSGSWSSDECYVKASVANFVAYNEYYAKPEAPLMIVANFDNDEFNANEWAYNSTRVSSGSGIIAKDGVLRFEGAGQGSAIAAQFKYSNFEIQYEIFDMKNTPSVGESNRPVAPSTWQMLCWGYDGDSAAGVIAYFSMPYALIIETGTDLDPDSPTYLQRHPEGGGSVHFYKDNAWQSATPLPEKYDFTRPGFDPEKKVFVRLANLDGKATLYLKLEEEEGWTEIWSYTYPNGNMPLGYVLFRGEGNQNVGSYSQYDYGSWYSVDNILLKNYDKNPSLVTVTFKSNRLPVIPDYDYKDPYVDSYLIDYTGGKP